MTDHRFIDRPRRAATATATALIVALWILAGCGSPVQPPDTGEAAPACTAEIRLDERGEALLSQLTAEQQAGLREVLDRGCGSAVDLSPDRAILTPHHDHGEAGCTNDLLDDHDHEVAPPAATPRQPRTRSASTVHTRLEFVAQDGA